MENAVKTHTTYQVSIDLLNDAVGKEIATSLQYMYFHTHFEDDRYQYLSKIMREISIAEMRHIEEFSDRILFLQGDVDMNASFRTRQVTDVKDMLRLALQLEQSTIDSYNEASRIASEHKDAVTHKMFQDIIAEEEQHLDTFRTELQNVLDYGEEYLALQSAAGSKHAAKSFGHPGDGDLSVLPDRYRGCLPGRIPFFNRICVSALCGTGSPRFGGDFPCLRAADPPMRPLRRR